jgi:hypothetical protein
MEGLPAWLWQPVFEAGHHEKLPVKLLLAHAHTVLAEHSDRDIGDISLALTGSITYEGPSSAAGEASSVAGGVCFPSVGAPSNSEGVGSDIDSSAPAIEAPANTLARSAQQIAANTIRLMVLSYFVGSNVVGGNSDD